MYSLKGYGSMVADSVRTGAYEHALRDSVKPGDVVLDLGTGMGIFAMLACRFGAKKVYAVEPSNVIHAARELAEVNGFSDRIDFIQQLSTEIDLPEKVDVIVADIRGITPLEGSSLSALADARNRFLAAGGVLIPQEDTLKTALVQAPELHSPLILPWGPDSYGFDLSAIKAYLTNGWFGARLKVDQLMSDTAVLVTLDYRVVESTDFKSRVYLTVARSGAAHGFCLWFDATLLPGIGFSGSPGQPEIIYRHAFFPWPEAVELTTGDVVELDLEARLVGGEYLWNWNSTIRGHDESGPVKASFRQSTFYSEPLGVEPLRKCAASHVPVLNEAGETDLWILARMAEGWPLGEISDALAGKYPRRFATQGEALTAVGELSLKFSR